jgi:BirA family biotin operon repressor/biotin-[acetyl-CoA-carboxylase] ligase
MLEAAADLAGAAASRLVLKWPNDLVLLQQGELRKLGGVLAEVETASGSRPGSLEVASAVIGLGINVDWRAEDFPAELATTMTSLSEAAGRPVDRDRLLDDWLARLAWHYGELLADRFEARAWSAAQATTGAQLVVETRQGRLMGLGLGVDPESGSLRVRERASGEVRQVPAGDVVACRVQGSAGGL